MKKVKNVANVIWFWTAPVLQVVFLFLGILAAVFLIPSAQAALGGSIGPLVVTVAFTVGGLSALYSMRTTVLPTHRRRYVYAYILVLVIGVLAAIPLEACIDQCDTQASSLGS